MNWGKSIAWGLTAALLFILAFEAISWALGALGVQS